MIITVTVDKKDWSKPIYTLIIDGVYYEEFGYKSSRLLTDTIWADNGGIFSRYQEVDFMRGDTKVVVDFGGSWEPSEYSNPALEIARRVAIVNAAFDEVRESYERSYTVTL